MGETPFKSASDLLEIPTAKQPTVGQGLTLDDLGRIPESVNPQLYTPLGESIFNALKKLNGPGVVRLLPGVYPVDSTITLTAGQQIIGSGRGIAGTSGSERGVTTLTSSYNGNVVVLSADAAGVSHLTVCGDRSKTSQNLVVGSDLADCYMHDVDLINAGQDGLLVDGAENALFLRVRINSSLRYAMRHGGAHPGDANANTFVKCLFRTSNQWGVYFDGGTGVLMAGCTIESNNLDAAHTYGGIRMIDGSMTTECCYLENNSGSAGSPVTIDGGYWRDNGTQYSESRQIIHNSGEAAIHGSLFAIQNFLTSGGAVPPWISAVESNPLPPQITRAGTGTVTLKEMGLALPGGSASIVSLV